MKEVTGQCRYCGQTQIMQLPDNYTEKDITEEATRSCKCAQAKHYVRVEERIAGAESAIREMFKDYPSLEDVKNTLLGAARLVAENKYNKITISKGKYAASMKPGKEALKISLKYTDECTKEI